MYLAEYREAIEAIHTYLTTETKGGQLYVAEGARFAFPLRPSPGPFGDDSEHRFFEPSVADVFGAHANKFRLEPQKSDLLHSNFESTDCAFSRKSASKFLHITCSIQRDDAERSKPPEPIDQID